MAANGDSSPEEASPENCDLREVVRALCSKIDGLVEEVRSLRLGNEFMRVPHAEQRASSQMPCLSAEAPGTVHQSGQPATFSEVHYCSPVPPSNRRPESGQRSLRPLDPCPTGFYSRKQPLERWEFLRTPWDVRDETAMGVSPAA